MSLQHQSGVGILPESIRIIYSASCMASRLPNQRWQIAPAQPDRAVQLSEAIAATAPGGASSSLALSPLLTQVLINRGMDTLEAARTYLDPEQQVLPSPLEEFPDLPIALELLLQAIATQAPIAICGDYDADGMTSTALLLRALRFLGADVDYAIPSRMQEGYGLNQRIVEEFHAEGVKMILTVDNGIAAHEPIARARELGLTVIVTDHHDLPPTLPDANAILNPKLIDATSPYYGVAGVGVAYILAVSLAQCLKRTQDLTTPLIELFTLGTIADLAPLTGVNRRWVKRGLKLLPKSRIPGIQALIQVAGLSNEKELKPEAIGFRLGPRINAIGRVSDPQIVIELLTTDDDGRALELAMKCEQVNQTRQRLCEMIELQAIAWCESSQINLVSDRVLVVVQPDWHHGVIGIVASRLVERYGVPVFIGTYEDETQQHIRGSARSIPEFNVFEALEFSGDLLERYGGHRAAGGFSLKAENLEAWRSRLILYANHQLLPEHLKPLVKIDVQAKIGDLTMDLFNQIDRLHPCGIENPDPVFWTENVRLLEQQPIGKNQAHLKVMVADGEHSTLGIKGIAWRWGDYYPLPEWVDIAYRLRLNEWNGTRSVELELVGVRSTSSSERRPKKTQQSEPSPQTSAHRSIGVKNSRFLAAEAVQSVDAALDIDCDSQPTRAQIATVPCPQVSFWYENQHYTCQMMAAIPEPGVPSKWTLEIQLVADLTAEFRQVLAPSTASFDLLRTAIAALEQVVHSEANREANSVTRYKIDPGMDSQLNVHHAILVTEQQQTIGQYHAPTDSRLEIQINTTQVTQAIPVKSSSKKHVVESKSLAVQNQIGESIWHRLNSLSQKDLVAVYEYRLAQASPAQPTAQLELDASSIATHSDHDGKNHDGKNHDDEETTDYSEIALRLCTVVEREIVQVFFKELYQFAQLNEFKEIAGIPLKARKKYTLGMLPPLIASHWQTLREGWHPEGLKRDALGQGSIAPQSFLEDDALYQDAIAAHLVSESDRQLLQTFLSRWDHPIAKWLSQHSVVAASAIAQVHVLQTIALRSDCPLLAWQFELLNAIVIGDRMSSLTHYQLTKKMGSGILAGIYGITSP